MEERGKHAKDARGGVPTYTIDHYNDLDELLSKQWHMRVLNVNGDFLYIILHGCQPSENFDRDNCTYNMTLHYYNYVHAIIIVPTKLMMMKMTMNMIMSMTGSSQWLSCIV